MKKSVAELLKDAQVMIDGFKMRRDNPKKINGNILMSFALTFSGLGDNELAIEYALKAMAHPTSLYYTQRILAANKELLAMFEKDLSDSKKEFDNYKHLPKCCRTCLKLGIVSEKTMSYCPCKRVYYCSVACQKQDWLKHKLKCKWKV